MDEKTSEVSERRIEKEEQRNLIDAGRNMRYCEEEDDFITSDSKQLYHYMENEEEDAFHEYLLPDKSLYLFVVMDIVLPELKKSTCFTKRYIYLLMDNQGFQR